MARLKFEELEVLDESAVPRTASRSEWLALFLRIEKGKALAIPVDKAPASSVREAVNRLKDSKQLPPNYVFTSRKQSDGKQVSYVINSASKELGKRRTRRVNGTGDGKINVERVRKLILDKPSNYEHSLPEIQKELYGKQLSSRDDVEEYHRIYNIVRRAREQIEAETGGRFIQELQNDGSKVYRLKK